LGPQLCVPQSSSALKGALNSQAPNSSDTGRNSRQMNRPPWDLAHIELMRLVTLSFQGKK